MRRFLGGGLVVLVCGACAAGCGSDDDKQVAGRTASESAAPVTSWESSVRRTRVVDAATGTVSVRFEARIEVAGASAAFLRTPTGEELALEAGDAAFEVAAEGGAASVETRFPAGGYSFIVEQPAGRDASGTILAGPFPSGPTLLAPTEGALLRADELTVRWAGIAPRHDVRVVDATSGDVVHERRDSFEREDRVPAELLAGGGRFRIEVLAVDAPAGARARSSAGVAIHVDVAP